MDIYFKIVIAVNILVCIDTLFDKESSLFNLICKVGLVTILALIIIRIFDKNKITEKALKDLK